MSTTRLLGELRAPNMTHKRLTASRSNGKDQLVCTKSRKFAKAARKAREVPGVHPVSQPRQKMFGVR